MTPTPPPYDDATIARIATAMFNRTLPKPEWTHAAHVATAIWVIAARPDLVPSRDIPPAIRAYNEATGVANTNTDGYHETITLASLRAAAAFVHARPGASLASLCSDVLASPLGRSDWLLAYWSRPVLFSVAARRAWVDPDIRPFPY